MPRPSCVSPRLRAFALSAALLTLPPLVCAIPTSVFAQPTAGRAHGDPQAEAFVQTQADRALAILNNPSMDLAAKKRAFYGFVNQVADVPRITDFVLGRYRRTITPDQYRRFAAVFREYADSIYEDRLSQYHGERLTVTGSVVRQPGDVVVTSSVTGGDFRGRPTTVDWRVMQGPDGRWRVVDVQAQGVWLAVVEQQDFTSTLANAGGDVDVLIRQLQDQLARGGAEPSGRRS